MIQKLTNVYKSIARIISNIWNNIPLHHQGKILTMLPIIAVIISASVAILGNYQRARIESAMQHHVQMSQGFNDILALMVNAETGMRGYLLTRDQDFLEPYAVAEHGLPMTIAEISALTESEPGGSPRLRKLSMVSRLTVLIDQQMTDLDWQWHTVDAGSLSADQMSQHLAIGKQLMDEIRENVGTMQREEDRLLLERMQDIHDIRVRDYIAVFLTLAVGLGTRLIAWYLFSRGVIRRIEHLAVNTRSLEHGGPLPFPPSGKQDAIGRLEQEIAHLARKPSSAARSTSATG